MFKRILLAVDGSPDALHAAALGVDLARTHGATLIGAFVTTPLEIPEVFPEAAVLDAHARERYRECVNREAGACLDEVAVRAHDAGVAWHSLVVSSASPALALIDAAADQHADLIVLGARGRGRRDGLPLGGTAAKVLQLSAVPVLLGRDAATAPGAKRA